VPFFFDTLEIVIVDAPPVPIAVEQCKSGGWRGFALPADRHTCGHVLVRST
jgi:hypothetical protein